MGDAQTTGTLAKRCTWQFRATTIEQGRRYADNGRVTLVNEPEATAIHARVAGSNATPYQVVVAWSQSLDGILIHCTCSVGWRLELCKHAYATLIAADQTGGKYEGLFPAHYKRLQCWADADPLHDDLTEADWGVVPSDPDEESESNVAAKPNTWRDVVDRVVETTEFDHPPHPAMRRTKQLEYHIDREHDALRVQLVWRNVLASGGLGKARSAELTSHEIRGLDPRDAEILHLARGCENDEGDRFSYYAPTTHQLVISGAVASEMLPRLCETKRFGVPDDSEPHAIRPLTYQSTPLTFQLHIEPGEQADELRMRGVVVTADGSVDVTHVDAIFAGGVVIVGDTIGRLDNPAHDAWAIELRRAGNRVTVPADEADELMDTLADAAHLPRLAFSDAVEWRVVQPEPIPVLRFIDLGDRGKLFAAQLWFVYPAGDAQSHEGTIRAGGHASAVRADGPAELILRNPQAEEAFLHKLPTYGFAYAPMNAQSRYRSRGGADVQIAASDFAQAVYALNESGWRVEADDKPLRTPGAPALRVSSGVDWFEVSLGEVGEANLRIPELLRAIRKNDRFVTLSDGSSGLLPEAWLERYASLGALGETNDDGTALLINKSSGVLLDALLAAHPTATVDADYEKFRRELQRFEQIVPAKPHKSFVGELRGYQRLGLGWLRCLARLGLGGCLADDMGLGKTVQVLALLAGSRSDRPTLVVAPKSLIFNWLDEAKRFTPTLVARSYVGPKRKKVDLDGVDIVVTTYGTLRRDIPELRKRRFHYVVLDEASAIKNPKSQIAKACRLLSADHRLALTGTPVENRLSDLASILEFLNPGMVRATQALETLHHAFASADEMATLAKALKPLLLRRRKEDVLQELPPKTEQVMLCNLGRKQRKLYNELRDHYRALLDKTIRKQGLARSKMHVLEALLRLRQAACHPGLIDPDQRDEPSAKLDALMDPLVEVVDAGHKVLVFSQFVSFLTIARRHLDEREVPYAYLDGKTRKRKEQVERFQTDPKCPVFLISLKAGGHGLNLTAAEYVFLLDPWWNPAVEAQAVDRAHRIGQTKPVFSYRMIAENTVEDRVLELQASKRELAEGIFAGTRANLGSLTADDLKLLLS